MRKHLGLYTDLYELTMMQGYFLNGRADEPATFDYFFRKNPFGGSFTVFAGLSDLLESIPKVEFSDDDIAYLRTQGFRKSFLSYLKDFRFSGDIHSVEEGEIVFPEEPVLSVRGKLAETQLLETLVLNVLNFQSLIATKAARIRHAAGDKTFIDFGLRRAQGWGGMAASKAAIIGGADATSNVIAAKENEVPASGTMAHSWIQSYENEYEAFVDFARLYKEKTILLVDTYDTLHSGVPNAIKVAGELASEDIKIKGIRLDSGDLGHLSRESRKMLDEAGLRDMIIVASNQQDEHTIQQLLSSGAPIDGFGVGTSLITGQPDAALDGVYKLAQVDGRLSLKLSESVEKITVPGNKKLGRYYGRNGRPLLDVVLLEEQTRVEKLRNKDGSSLEVPAHESFKILSRPVVKDGYVLEKPASAKSVANRVTARLKNFPDDLRGLDKFKLYQTGLTEKLFGVMKKEIDKQKRNRYESADGS